MKLTLICLFISYIGIYATCNKRWDCSQIDYTFEASFRAYPDKDSIRINDTIWLETTIPTKLTDGTTGDTMDFSGAVNLGTAILYGELLGGDMLNPGTRYAANDFEHQLQIGMLGEIERPERIRYFSFLEENGFYVFKVAIIPKKTGLFYFSPGSATNVYRKKDNCRKAAFSLTFKDTDQHIYLYEQSRPGYTVSEYEKTHSYFFKVY